MRYIYVICLLLLSCDIENVNQISEQFGRKLTDCPTAKIETTSITNRGYTSVIKGCGMKICCADTSCFSCKQEQ